MEPTAQPSPQTPPVSAVPTHTHLPGVSAKLCDDMHRDTSIEGLEPDECVITVIHKHPIGLVSLYLGAFIGVVGAFGLVFFLIPQLVSAEQRSQVNLFVSVVLVLATMLLAIGVIVATYVYRQSKIIITNKNVTQVIQRSLFSRKVSELSMSNVEDVTAEKNGIIAAIFNFGRLNIETAGEVENFIFDYCPRPNQYGRIILDARQRYADSIREND